MVKLDEAERKLAWFFFEFRAGARAQSYEPAYGHDSDPHARLVDTRHMLDMDRAHVIRDALCACPKEARTIELAYTQPLHSVLLKQYFFRKTSRVSIVALALFEPSTVASCAKACAARIKQWEKSPGRNGKRPREETRLEHLQWLASQRDEKSLRPIVKATMATFEKAVDVFAARWETSLAA